MRGCLGSLRCPHPKLNQTTLKIEVVELTYEDRKSSLEWTAIETLN